MPHPNRHDEANQLSREYVEYVETLLYDVWKERLGGGPLYAAIGSECTVSQSDAKIDTDDAFLECIRS